MHRRTRTRTTLLLSAGLLAAVPVLTACGSQPHPGAAALVGGGRIEMSAVQGQVKDVRAAQAKAPQSAQLISNTGQMNRAKLHSMLFTRVVERAAADAGAEASRKEIQQARGAAAAQAQGEDKLAQMLVQRGIAPGQIDQAVREEILLNKIAAANQANLATPDGQAKVTEVLAKASKALHISVNPRYGTWDNEKIGLADRKAPWITQRTKSAEAQAAEQPAAEQPAAEQPAAEQPAAGQPQ
ncbi:SurA N-terminal domain-containing protein [Streptomyces sp. NPDC091272]|uniref:SurA N-terminal domain-containing protein n=1 Tax=Streptomyces sp. NPDC091272 TaxID=3365981 RepID=UPI0038067F0D